MTTIKIRQELQNYIKVVESKKLKALYTILEDDIKIYTYDKWEDQEFIDELKRRSKSFLDGTAKTYTWEEVQASVREASAQKRNKPE